MNPTVVRNIDLVVSGEDRRNPTKRKHDLNGHLDCEHLPLNLIVGELFTGDNDGKEDEETDGIFVVQSIGEIIVTSNAEMSDGR